MKNVWKGKDAFVLLPTGCGNSIIYTFVFDYKPHSLATERSVIVVTVRH